MMPLLLDPETATRLRHLSDVVSEARRWEEGRKDSAAKRSHGSATRCAKLRDRAARTARAMLPSLDTLDVGDLARAELARLP